MEEKNYTHDSNHDALFQKLLPQSVHGAFNQVGAVVADFDRHPFRKALLQLGQLFFDVLYDLSGIGAVADNDDASDRFTFTIPFRNSPANLRAILNGCQIP